MSDENKNPYDLIDKENTEKKENKDSQNFENIKNNFQEKATNFLENIIRKIAKKAWLPDPKTGKPITDTKANETPNNIWSTTLEQDIVTQEQEEKKNLNFENIMSGVWDVINKIGQKIWEKTWINLNPQEKQEQKQESNETESTTINDQTTENKVETNNEELSNK